MSQSLFFSGKTNTRLIAQALQTAVLARINISIKQASSINIWQQLRVSGYYSIQRTRTRKAQAHHQQLINSTSICCIRLQICKAYPNLLVDSIEINKSSVSLIINNNIIHTGMERDPRDTQTVVRQSHIAGSNNTMYQAETGNNPKIFILKEERISAMLGSDDEQFNSKIEVSSLFAWSILFLNSIFSSFVPCWLMGDVKSESFTRNAWRYFTVSMLLIPFVLFEQRNIKNQGDWIINCLTKQKLKPIFISTINFCIWLLLLINACRWTSMNHAVCLTDMKFFMISLMKFKNGLNLHQFEVGGSMICMIGLALLFSDSILTPQSLDPTDEKYLRAEPWKRLVLGDGLALFGSLASYYLDFYYKTPVMPRFTYLFIYNVFLTFNLVTFGYFFGGSEFSFHTKFGVFGLFTYTNFVSVFYVSIMLGMMLIMTNILVREIFSQLIINIASRFQIVQTSLIYHIIGLQRVPNGLTCLGYSFLLPGLVFILGGQFSLENKQNNFNFQLYQPLDNKRISKMRMESEVMSPTQSTVQVRKNMPFLEILEEEEGTGQHSVEGEEMVDMSKGYGGRKGNIKK